MIDAEGEQVGVVSAKEAVSRAMEAGLDLVEISPNATPPVCKIMDYGKFKFQQQKKAQEAKKKQVTVTVKEISIRPTTEEHDYQVKLRNIRRFLERGDKVKINLRFRGREITHQDLGEVMLNKIEEDTQDIARVTSRPKMEGRQMVMMLEPEKAKKAS